MSTQGILIVLCGLGLLASTLALVRRQMLSIRFGLGWLTVALLAIAGAPVLELLAPRVGSLGFTPTGFSLGILAGFLALVCLQLSISLSGVQRTLQDLAEHAALVEHRLRELEQSDDRTPR